MKKAATLYDYIKWRGDLKFIQVEFNEMDAAILSQLIYTDFSQIIPLKEGDKDYITLRQLGEIIKKNAKYSILNGDYLQRKEEYNDFLIAACDSERYGNIRIKKYTDITVVEENIQFAAATFELDNGVKVVTFRGTDDSVVGWKEDFMLSYETTGSQRAAGEYIDARLKDELTEPFYICGHSKGGNLAIYAAAGLADDKLEMVQHIYMFDGPGICDTILEEERIINANPEIENKINSEEKIRTIYKRLDEKTTRISPESCFIGKIFEAKFTDTRIVKSTAKGLGQHSLVTWQVNYYEFFYSERFERASVWAGRIFDEWLRKQDMDKRKVFVEDIFGAFEEAGIVSFNDILKHGFSSIRSIAEAVAGISGVTKRMAMELPKTGINDLGKKNRRKKRNYIRLDDK